MNRREQSINWRECVGETQYRWKISEEFDTIRFFYGVAQHNESHLLPTDSHNKSKEIVTSEFCDLKWGPPIVVSKSHVRTATVK
jgi:hypothetical protein